MTLICPYCFKSNDRISLTTLRQPHDPPGPDIVHHGLLTASQPPKEGFYYCSRCYGMSKIDATGVLIPARFDEVPRTVVEYYFYEHVRKQRVRRHNVG